MTGGVLFLAGYTNRSKAYAQAMRWNRLKPDQVLIFGKSSLDQPLNLDLDEEAILGLRYFVPDLREPLIRTCKDAKWTINYSPHENVNHQDIVRQVNELKPKLIIYSGYPGQLVKADLLDLGVPILHMHSGWLPEYCGSTTLYYSWLRENECAVSAFFLDAKIDNGPIIARRRYPPPPPGIDIDHLYDGAIRADLLISVLSESKLQKINSEGRRRIYYVIHPVLKHLAHSLR